MRKYSKFIIANISILGCLTLLIYLSFYFFKEKKAPSLSDHLYKVFPVFKEELVKRWTLGDREESYVESGFTCEDLLLNKLPVSGEFFNCNFLYLECFFRGGTINNFKNFKFKNQGEEFTFTPIKEKGSYLKLQANQSVKIKFLNEESKKIFSVELFNTCNNRYLPEDTYSAGDTNTKTNLFDTYSQNIFIDKTYFSYKDFYEVKIKENNDWSIIKPNLVALPYTRISLKERENLCRLKGGKLLRSRYFDAGSFFPQSNKNPQVYFYKDPYPWQKGRSGSFLYEARFNKNFTLSKKDCDKAFVFGCFSIKDYFIDSTESISYMGIYFPLGGYLESFKNDFKVQDNLKVSSFYLNPASSYHEIGKRGEWSGESFEREDFKFFESFDSPPPYEVAFRCFYERGD